MKVIYYKSDKSVTLGFASDERNLVLEILRRIPVLTGKASVLGQIIADIEMDLLPRLVVEATHFHFCEKCKCEIDDRVSDNFIHYKNAEKEEWRHRNCPPLKLNRPV